MFWVHVLFFQTRNLPAAVVPSHFYIDRKLEQKILDYIIFVFVVIFSEVGYFNWLGHRC
jgi:hypothetical protein